MGAQGGWGAGPGERSEPTPPSGLGVPEGGRTVLWRVCADGLPHGGRPAGPGETGLALSPSARHPFPLARLCEPPRTPHCVAAQRDLGQQPGGQLHRVPLPGQEWAPRAHHEGHALRQHVQLPGVSCRSAAPGQGPRPAHPRSAAGAPTISEAAPTSPPWEAPSFPDPPHPLPAQAPGRLGGHAHPEPPACPQPALSLPLPLQGILRKTGCCFSCEEVGKSRLAHLLSEPHAALGPGDPTLSAGLGRVARGRPRPGVLRGDPAFPLSAQTSARSTSTGPS